MPRLVSVLLLASVVSAQQPPSTAEPLHRPFDQILDLYVRDGYVYYRALRAERAALDRYVASLNVTASEYAGWSREQKIAYWLNAYNAFVLQTVAQHFPIQGRAKQYPAGSIRQVSGAFEQKRHRAVGRQVSLDEIEKSLAEFQDPRVYFALGRGAAGSGRLRSEAYSADRLEQQLAAQTTDFLSHQNHLQIDRSSSTIAVSPIVGWHEAEFAAAYGGADKAPPYAASRSPIERAVIALIHPVLLPSEREFIGQNQFKLSWQEFDWKLNDLGAR